MMGNMSGLVTNIGDLVNWERYNVLRIPPKNPDSSADVEIGVDDRWAYFDLVANWNGNGRTEDLLIHGTGQHSLWSILGGMQVTASLASDELVGVWTSLKASEALGYSTLAHYGQNTWARVAICFEPPVTKENLFSGHPALMGVRRGAQRVIPYARLGFSGICIHLEHPAVDSQWVELCASGGDSDLQYFNPVVECNPHAPETVWAMHKFFPGNYMGPVGLSVEEENLQCAPGTPSAAMSGTGSLFARIVPRSNMNEAITGDTFDVRFTQGYLQTAEEEAKCQARGMKFKDELECFKSRRRVMSMISDGKIIPGSMELPKGGYSRHAVEPAQLDRLWEAWATVMLSDVLLPIYPSVVLNEITHEHHLIYMVMKCLAASGSGASFRLAAAASRNLGPPIFKEEKRSPDATVFYLLDHTFNFVSKKKTTGFDIPSLESAIETNRSKNDKLRGAPNARPFKDYRVHYVSSSRNNEETSLRMLIEKAYELIEARTNECKEKFGDPDRALSDLYILGTRTSHLYTWGKDDRWRVNQGANDAWIRELEHLQNFSQMVPVLVCGPGRSLGRTGDQGTQMQKDAEHRMNDIRCRGIPVVSADAVSWGAEIDHYGRTKQMGRGNAVMPAFLAALPDYYSMTTTEWPLEATIGIREAMLAELERRSSSKIGRSRSVSDAEDVDMGVGSTGFVAGQPPVGETPSASSGSGTRRTEEEPRVQPRAMLTGEEMGARRPKSPPMPPRSTAGTRSRSPPPVATPANAGLPAVPEVPEVPVTNRWSSGGRTAEDREQPEIEDLLTNPPLDEFAGEEPSEVVENPADTDTPMETAEESTAMTDEDRVHPVRETSPSVPETPRERERESAPGREGQEVNVPEGRTEAEPETAVSTPRARRPEVPEYADDDEDLRGTAKTEQKVATGEQVGGVHDNVGLPYPEHPGRAPELDPPAIRPHREAQLYAAARGPRTSAKPAETPSHRLFIINHILAREAGEPFIYAVIRNKAITKSRVSLEEWEAAQKSSHIVIPTRLNEQQEILDRAVHNDFMYGAIDAARVTARVDWEYVDPRNRATRPWADQVWDMKKKAREASDIPVGMRNDIQAKR